MEYPLQRSMPDRRCKAALRRRYCTGANKVHAMPEPSGPCGINLGAAAGFHDKLVIH